jgi:hypothetical protein
MSIFVVQLEVGGDMLFLDKHFFADRCGMRPAVVPIANDYFNVPLQESGLLKSHSITGIEPFFETRPAWRTTAGRVWEFWAAWHRARVRKRS